MEASHIRGILAMAPEARGKTFLLGKWQDDTEIPDPYRKSEEMFKQIYKLIDEATASWVKMIQK
jgi:protein-tyrosine phosphatase